MNGCEILLIGSTSQLFCFRSIAKHFLTIELHVTLINVLKSDILVSVIVTVYCNVWRRYHDFKGCVILWSKG